MGLCISFWSFLFTTFPLVFLLFNIRLFLLSHSDILRLTHTFGFFLFAFCFTFLLLFGFLADLDADSHAFQR